MSGPPVAPRHLTPRADVARARQLIDLYPEPRSALVPLCHLAQEQDGWLRPEAMEDIAELVGVTPAEVLGTASFYDMLHTEPVGTYLVAVCTNIACLLGGALELLAHAETSLGVNVGGTTADGAITLEEAECLADCDRVPCVQVNHRFVGGPDPRVLRPAGRRAAVRRARRGDPAARDAQPGGRARPGWRPTGRRWRRSGRPWPRPRRPGPRRPRPRRPRPGRRGTGSGPDGPGRPAEDRHEPARPRRLPHPRPLPGHGRLRGTAQGPRHDPRGRRPRGRHRQPAGPGRRRVPRRAQVGHAAQGPGDLPGGQRRRERAGHLQGPPAHRAGPAPADRRRAHRGLRPPGVPGVHLHPGRVRPRPRTGASPPSTRPMPTGRWAPTSSDRASRSTWWCTRGPAPTSAARRRRCSSPSRASAASPASSLPSSRPPSASTASPPWSTTSRRCPTSPGSCATAGRPSPHSARGGPPAPGCSPWPATSNNPGVFELEMVKTTFGDLIYAPELGGGIPGGRELKAFIPGGVSAPWFGPDQLDLPLGQDEVAAAGSMLGSGSIVVMDDHTCAVRAAWRITKFFARESCGQCTPCREGSGWLERILFRIEHGEGREEDLDLLLDACDNIAPGLELAAPADDHLRPRTVDPVLDRLGHRDVPRRVPRAHQGSGLSLWLTRHRPRAACPARRPPPTAPSTARPQPRTAPRSPSPSTGGRSPGVKGEMLIAAAERAGTFIPRFCYHPRMKSVGVCRMCLVEVSGPRGASLQPSCFVEVQQGATVVTDSDKVKQGPGRRARVPPRQPPARLPGLRQGRRVPAPGPDPGLRARRVAVRRGEAALREADRHLRAGAARP